MGNYGQPEVAGGSMHPCTCVCLCASCVVCCCVAQLLKCVVIVGLNPKPYLLNSKSETLNCLAQLFKFAVIVDMLLEKRHGREQLQERLDVLCTSLESRLLQAQH